MGTNCKQSATTYDSATGRIAESDGFRWEYLDGTNLKSQLTYPNDAVVTWTYEPHRDLLIAVTNATYSTYTYTNDLLGRRTSKNDEQYGYNVRDELVSADEVSYNYDDIGNRMTAEGKTYTANNLNQYTAIDDFVPQYDADGNQTLIQTSTGVWSVIYNAENRPIRWQSGDTIITMSFDRMGRRVEMRTLKDGSNLLQRFVYNNYLCVQQLRASSNTLYHSYVWDPTEPIATRPLVFQPASGEISYYFHDGNKNVSDLVSLSDVAVHYAYTPFGTPTASASSENPFLFSSEFYDESLRLSYYNYRHYNSQEGRWCRRDPQKNSRQINTYIFVDNNTFSYYDKNGESAVTVVKTIIITDTVVPDPTDVVAVPKALGYCVLLAGAYLADYASACISEAVTEYLERKAFEKKVKDECIKECSDTVLEHPKHRDNFPDFRRCVRECCARSGVTY